MSDWKETCAKCRDGEIEPRNCEYYGDPNGCNSPTYGEHKPVGNAAAMREALETLRKRFDNNTMAYQDRYIKFSGWHWHKKAKEAARWRDVFHELREVCDAALSEPPRQCDVGTPEEKYRRWVNFCEQRLHSCNNCECNVPEGCTFKFGDMPYIKEVGGRVIVEE